MAWMNDISNLLQQYGGSEGTHQSPDVEQDFNQVAQVAPPSVVSSGLASAFRSDQTPPFPEMLSTMFGQSNGEQRAGILNQLIASAGPALLSSGILSGLGGLLGGGTTVTPAQAQQVSPDDVKVLAAHAEKHDPSIIDQASDYYAQHPTLVKALGAGALALMMSKISQHR